MILDFGFWISVGGLGHGLNDLQQRWTWIQLEYDFSVEADLDSMGI